jgi:hypothetical protein
MPTPSELSPRATAPGAPVNPPPPSPVPMSMAPPPSPTPKAMETKVALERFQNPATFQRLKEASGLWGDFQAARQARELLHEAQAVGHPATSKLQTGYHAARNQALKTTGMTALKGGALAAGIYGLAKMLAERMKSSEPQPTSSVNAALQQLGVPNPLSALTP